MFYELEILKWKKIVNQFFIPFPIDVRCANKPFWNTRELIDRIIKLITRLLIKPVVSQLVKKY